MCHVEDRKEISSVLHPLYAVDSDPSSILHVAGNVICHAGRKCEVEMKINVMYISCLCPARGNATFGLVEVEWWS